MTATMERGATPEMLRTIDDAGPNVVAVAVDGSHESRHALEWAVDHAHANGLLVRVVTAYLPPQVTMEHPVPHVELDVDAATVARRRAETVITDVVGDGAAALAIEHIVVAGSIDRALIDRAADVAMFVIGTRTQRRWIDRLRGSATNRLTGQVNVPVMAIPCGPECVD